MIAALITLCALATGDAAAFRTIIADRFGDHHARILVADKTPASVVYGTEGVSLRDSSLGPNVTLVPDQTWVIDILRQGPREAVAALAFHLPRVKDSETVEVSYDVGVADGAIIRSGRGSCVLRPSKNGGWSIVEKHESLVSFDPREDPHAFRVGGDVRAPVKIAGAEPVPTEEAVNARVSGIVIVEVTIDEKGRVIGADVLKPLPFGLDGAAIEAIKTWRFRPGTLAGKPVPVLFNMTVSFKPKGESRD